MALTCSARCLHIRFNFSYFSHTIYQPPCPHIFAPHYLLCSLHRHFSKQLRVVLFLATVAIARNCPYTNVKWRWWWWWWWWRQTRTGRCGILRIFHAVKIHSKSWGKMQPVLENRLCVCVIWKQRKSKNNFINNTS